MLVGGDDPGMSLTRGGVQRFLEDWSEAVDQGFSLRANRGRLRSVKGREFRRCAASWEQEDRENYPGMMEIILGDGAGTGKHRGIVLWCEVPLRLWRNGSIEQTIEKLFRSVRNAMPWNTQTVSRFPVSA
jgi:hypothetical protein